MGHEAFAPEGCLLQEPGQGPGVVQVEVGDQEQVNLKEGRGKQFNQSINKVKKKTGSRFFIVCTYYL